MPTTDQLRRERNAYREQLEKALQRIKDMEAQIQGLITRNNHLVVKRCELEERISEYESGE